MAEPVRNEQGGNTNRADREALRLKHPRPDHLRREFIDLCGTWNFDFDPTNAIDGDTRMASRALSRQITVPYPPQSRASGVAETGFHPCVWYERTTRIPDSWSGRRVFLNFGAVDSQCTVFVNGACAGFHDGGYSSFRFDVTQHLVAGDNSIRVKVVDDLSRERPRGKQSWGAAFAVWYTPMSGIWQPVWLESTGEFGFESIRLRSADPADGLLRYSIRLDGPVSDGEVVASVEGPNGTAHSVRVPATFPSTEVSIAVADAKPWSPGHPVLYDVTCTLLVNGAALDEVETYVGFRTVSIDETGYVVNGKHTYLRFVLDQGVWPETLYAAPSGEALRRDISLAREMGFNGCRKHIKAEDPRFLYWADKLGFLVWCELPAAYADTVTSREAAARELTAQISRDMNHPSIITWVVFNESWGIPSVSRDPDVQSWVRTMFSIAKLADPSRPVIDNDGWEHVTSDVLTYHSYAESGDALMAHQRQYLDGDAPAGRRLMVDGVSVPRLPVIASELGGIGLVVGASRKDGWGYGDIPKSVEEFVRRLADLMTGVSRLKSLAGFCYTQLTDVEQEINGLLTAERMAKVAPERIRELIEGGVDSPVDRSS